MEEERDAQEASIDENAVRGDIYVECKVRRVHHYCDNKRDCSNDAPHRQREAHKRATKSKMFGSKYLNMKNLNIRLQSVIIKNPREQNHKSLQCSNFACSMQLRVKIAACKSSDHKRKYLQ